jgi:hypothetical protein
VRFRFERGLFVMLALAPLVVGCAPKKVPPAPVAEPAEAVLAKAQARRVPSPVQARFQIKVRSKPLGIGGTTSGGLQVLRPGRARVEIFGPLGGSLVSLVSDGAGFAAWLPKDQRHLFAPDAEALVRDATRGAVGIDGLLGLLVGDVPFSAAELRGLGVDEAPGRVRARFQGPDGVDVELDLDPVLLTPVRLVARDRAGVTLLQVDYEGWLPLDDHLLPAKVDLNVPSVELHVSLRYSTWKTPDALLSYATEPPPGVASEDLLDALRRSPEPPSP